MSVVVSVQHTGSRFVADRLGIDQSDIIHTYTELSVLLSQVDGRGDIVSPLRHPKDVWESWCRRGREDYPTFMLSFFTLGALASIRDVDFIAVDKQEDPRISDWTREYHLEKEVVSCPKVDLSPLRMIPFVREHYYAD
jgi:hypothetical protein